MTRPPSSATSPPLTGVRILEVTSGVAGQTAGMLLADLGADVVRPVGEPPAAEQCAGWLYRGRGKTLARTAAAPVMARHLSRLAARADIVLTDLRPGDVERWGLDASTVRSRSSRAVHAWLPPISACGRFAFLPHDDLLLDAVTGFAAHHPAFDDRPVASVVPTRHVLQGTMGAAHAVAALVGRERDGHARPFVVSGMHALCMAMGTTMVARVDGPALYTGSKHPEHSAPHFRLYQASDGRWLYLASLGVNLFLEALNAMDRMDLFARDDVAGDFANMLDPDIGPLVSAELQTTFRTKPAQEWVDLFRAHDVPAAIVGDRRDWLASDVVAHAAPPVKLHHPDVGALVLPGVPVDLSGTPARVGHVPSVSDMVDLETVWSDVDAAAPGDVDEAAGPVLAGLRVLDFATYLAAPLVGTMCAQLGAEVTKLQSPLGDPYRTYGGAYAAVNHLKAPLRLDLSTEAGHGEFLDRLSSTDVVVHNLRPASLERLGLADPVLARANPGLIRCSLSAYGDTGPWVDFPGFDPVMQALGGLAGAQGGEDRPITTGVPLHDNTAGALGTLGALAAVFARGRTGVGQRVATSLAATSTLLQGAELTRYRGRAEPPTGGRDYPGPTATHRFYRAADRWLAVAAVTDAERRALVATLGVEGDAASSDAELAAALADLFRSRPADEWVTALAMSNVPAAPVVKRHELDHPCLVEFGWSHVIDDADLGRLRVSRSYGAWPTVVRDSAVDGSLLADLVPGADR